MYFRLLIISLMTMASQQCSAAGRIRIWESSSVRKHGVTIEAFLAPQSQSNTAIIVCPGGSYCWHDYDTEGVEVAQWLRDNGYSAFVLKYRVLGKFQFASPSRFFVRGRRHPDMIADLQKAITYIRQNYTSPSFDQIGVMGFSAGGHLAMSAAEFHDTNFADKRTPTDTDGLRPDFVALVYPVVTMNGPHAHKRSRRALLGERFRKRQTLRDSLSLENHVPDDCSPVFMVNCKDDAIVDFQNSEMLDSALTKHNIPHRYILYETGNHSFGASDSKGTPESRQWKQEFLNWIKSIQK